MKKEFCTKKDVMETCAYTEGEFIEYFGDTCIGLIYVEDLDLDIQVHVFDGCVKFCFETIESDDIDDILAMFE